MNEREVAEAVEAWVSEKVTGLAQTYSHRTASKGALPDAMVLILRKFLRRGADERFPYSELQQTALKVFDVEVNFMVDITEGDGGEQENQLREFSAELEAAITTETTLGDRVQMVSTESWDVDYGLPFVEYPDGTRGRQMTFSFSVAEIIETAED